MTELGIMMNLLLAYAGRFVGRHYCAVREGLWKSSRTATELYSQQGVGAESKDRRNGIDSNIIRKQSYVDVA